MIISFFSTHIYAFVYMGICVHGCGSQKSVSGVFLSHIPPYYLYFFVVLRLNLGPCT